MTLNYLIWTVAGPATWPLWLGLAACLTILIGSRRWALRFAKLFLFAVLMLAVLPTGPWLMRWLENATPRPDAAHLDQVQHIIVLAGGENLAASARTGRLELGQHGDRVMQGVVLARQWPDAMLWTVGGMTDDKQRDVTLTRQLWRDLGIADKRIGVIDNTRDTCTNATGLRARIAVRDAHKILLVTSAFHMPRARLCFAAAGIRATPWPVDYDTGPALRWSINPLGNLAKLDDATHELVGLLWYRLSGRTQRLWPED